MNEGQVDQETVAIIRNLQYKKSKKVDNHPVFSQRKPVCQQKSGFSQCENSVANNSASITHRA